MEGAAYTEPSAFEEDKRRACAETTAPRASAVPPPALGLVSAPL